MRTRTLGVTVAIAMTGCAGSTDVIPTGPDTYMITSQGTVGPEQKAKAISEARDYCEKSGKRLEAINTISSGPGSYGKTSSAEVHFRCVTATSK